MSDGIGVAQRDLRQPALPAVSHWPRKAWEVNHVPDLILPNLPENMKENTGRQEVQYGFKVEMKP